MNTLDIIGAIIGLAYIVSEYRAGRWFWPLSLLMSAFYAVIDFSAHYYANGTICVYNFVMSVYGLLVWRGILWPSRCQDVKTSRAEDSRTRSHEVTKSQRQITSCPRRYWWQIILAVVLLSVVLWFLLSHLPNESSHPVIDGISSALTIVGMLMLAQKWWQQWFCWMLVEPMMIYLFQASGNYASVILYIVFEVFCILGIIRWRKQSIS